MHVKTVIYEKSYNKNLKLSTLLCHAKMRISLSSFLPLSHFMLFNGIGKIPVKSQAFPTFSNECYYFVLFLLQNSKFSKGKTAVGKYTK